MNLGDRESDLRQLRELHRRAVAPLVKACLGDHPDPDLRAFAAALPDQVDSVEAYLKRFWAERGYQAGAIEGFASRYGRALASCPRFREFEARMEALARSAGTPAFAARYRELAEWLRTQRP
ncbi:MAG: hypothetical protein DIU70_004525 [Bacillota bacterium]|nr:MAG: hypothetical protein DIU70_12850 [Bacillota bacterium]